MAYVAPTTRSVGDAVTAADYNIMANNDIAIRSAQVNLKSTIVTALTFSTASTSFVDITDLTVSITPSSNTSKIMVWWSVHCHVVGGPMHIRLVRGTTNIAEAQDGTSGMATLYTPDTTSGNLFSHQFLDSPATTSATTYKLQARVSSATFRLNRRNADTSYQGVSTITVMEVPA